MWKKIILLVVVLLLAAVVGSTVYVNNIDWNKHKDKISQQFSAATGKEVVFNGRVSLNIFPSPYLEVNDINIYNSASAGNEKVLLANVKKLVAQLSIKSLVSGNFNIEKMSMLEPEVFVELYQDGRLNWQSGEMGQQDFNVDNVEISLDSLMVEKAKMHIVSNAYDVNAVLDNLNAEIISQSIFGPYRIEGSYSKDGTPGGFAISLGQFSDSFATSVNAVVSHPQSDSYVRFDGTILLKNDAVNGSFIFESQNPINFINSNFKDVKLSENYEYPTAVSLELKTDKSEISLNNIVIKYGMTAGAGNILIPRLKEKVGENGMERRRIDAVFNMTELQLEPLVMLVDDFLKTYDKSNYIPEYDFDIIGDMKSVKTTYKNQVIREFDLSFDFIENIFRLQNLSALMPGDAVAKLKGEVYSVEKVLTYNMDLTSSALDFYKTSEWLGFKLERPMNNVYKKAAFNSTIAGTLQTIKIAPFDLSLDNTKGSGKLGIVRTDKTRWLLIVNADNINFDNYIADMPKEIKDNLEDKLNYRFAQLQGLNNIEGQLRGSLKTAIYGRTPLENLELEGTLKAGIMKVDNLSFNNMATADFKMSGEVSGFGKTPQVKNIKYKLNIKETAEFADKFKLNVPAANLRNLIGFVSNGVVTGGISRWAMRNTSTLGNIDFFYNGQVAKAKDKYNFSGKFEVKAPDFVRFLNDMSVAYSPNYPLGLFKLSGDIKGAVDAFVIKELSGNIGANQFNGDAIFVQKEGRNKLKTNLQTNRFEFEKFFYVKELENKNNFRPNTEKATLLAKPRLSLAKIDYTWMSNWDIDGKIKVGNLSLNNIMLKNTAWDMNLNKEILKINNFAGESDDGTVGANLEFNIPMQAKLSGKLKLNSMNVDKETFGGTVFGLTKGVYNADIDFATSADSFDSLLSQLSGSVVFNIDNAVVKGWNLGLLYDDLQKREVSEGFSILARDALSHGDTAFNKVRGEIKFTNGSFAISNTEFAANDYVVDMIADGSLKEWTDNASFSFILNDHPRIKGFDFSLEGSLNNPSLEVNVEAVSKVYDSHWEKLAADSKAEAEATKNKYRELMDEQQNFAEIQRKKLFDGVIPDYDAYKVLAASDMVKQYYSEIGKQIDTASALYQEINNKGKKTDINDDDIMEVKKQIKELVVLVAAVDKKLLDTHNKDVKLRISDSYNAIYTAYNQAKTLSSRMLDIEGGFGKRLAMFNNNFIPQNDKAIMAWKKQMADNFTIVDAINTEAAKENLIAQSTSNLDDLEVYSANFTNLTAKVEEAFANMEMALAAWLKYNEERISSEEVAYEKYLQEVATKKKLEENTGQISTFGGKTVMVERELEEIERVEDAVKNREVKVLDFSGDNSLSGSVSRKSAQEIKPAITQESGIIIKKMEVGDKVSGSGVITKQ